MRKRHRKCNEILNSYAKNGFLDQESYFRLTRFNDALATDLEWNISAGKDLLENELIERIDDLIKDVIESLGPLSIRQMFKLITSKSVGSGNSKDIKPLAANLGREATMIKLDSIDAQYELQNHFQRLGENSVDKLVDERTEIKEMEEKKTERLKRELKSHFLELLQGIADIAENIYKFVRDEMECIPERRDYVQPPLHTLKKSKGGDCDDLATLLCSLWESIGYETTLNLLPGHCFPGVKLMVPFQKDGKTFVQVCNIMADPTFRQNIEYKGTKHNMFELSYDLCRRQIGLKEFERFPRKLRDLYKKAESHTVPPASFKNYCQPIDGLRGKGEDG